jgi:septum formation protein
MLILASASPRRKELLTKITSSFTVIPAKVDERLLDGSLSPKDLPLEESRLKAYNLFSFYPHDEVLAVDTIVILHDQVLGKPKNKEDAIKMLTLEAGQKQIVLSGYTYLSPFQEVSRSVSTLVYFNPLSKEQIEEYVNKFKPFDKAGGYGIQDDFPLINHIEGSYDNVMGLPVEDLKQHVFTR